MENMRFSSAVNDVADKCSRELRTTVHVLQMEFEARWSPEMGSRPGKFVEFLGIRAINSLCTRLEENICSGYLSRLTFDIMLAWAEANSVEEGSAMEMVVNGEKDGQSTQHEDVSLFYSDITSLMPMDNDVSVGESAFAWLGVQMPFVADLVNRKFIFETLTTSTRFRLYFPVYDKFLKEIARCAKSLPMKNQPTGVDLAQDEFILILQGTAMTGRVVCHVKGKSLLGMLTLTNYSLYFKASGSFSSENTLNIDLSKDVEQHANPVCTGPWGAPILDRGISYYDPIAFPEGIIMEFPELTGSTRRDFWLVLIKEVILLHQFTKKFNICSRIHLREIHARMIFGIIRLYATKEFIKTSPPSPKAFLIFSLLDEIPKGDYMLEELAKSLKSLTAVHPCCATSVLGKITMSLHDGVSSNTEEDSMAGDVLGHQGDGVVMFDSIMDQAKEDAEKVYAVKTETDVLKEEGISDSVFVLIEQLKQITHMVSSIQGFSSGPNGARISLVLITLLVIYMGWVGKVAAAFLLFVVISMVRLRYRRGRDILSKVTVSTSSDSTITEDIVSVQKKLRTATQMVENANISILKIRSLLVSKTIKHADHVMMMLTGAAVALAVVPMNLIIVSAVLLYFVLTISEMGESIQRRGKRRVKEWWDSIPVFPLEAK